jgi:hypothetical protein
MTVIPELQHDLVAAAARMTTRRQRFRRRLRATMAVAAAAAVIAAALVVVGGGASDRAPSSREPAGPPDNNPPSSTVSERSLEPPSPGGPRPIPGSLSRPVRFTFNGIHYSIVGFRGGRRPRERNTTICTRLVEGLEGPGRRLAGQTCAGEQLLRRELDDNPVRTVGRGGGEYTFVSGFARADVTSIAVIAPRYPSRAVLSEPWSPPGWRGKPIRFFEVVIDPPREASPEFPLRSRIRLQGRLTDGETVEGVP